MNPCPCSLRLNRTGSGWEATLTFPSKHAYLDAFVEMELHRRFVNWGQIGVLKINIRVLQEGEEAQFLDWTPKQSRSVLFEARRKELAKT